MDGFIAAIPGSMEKGLVQRYYDFLERSQISWRLSRLLSLDSIKQDLGRYLLQQWSSPHYIRLYNEVQQEDQPLSKIEKNEQDYFRNKDLRETIAKKLTLISEWKARSTTHHSRRLRKNMFIASPDLWKWIQRFMQDWEDMS
ncbi:unnamed protein product [Penicillium glandicola]